MKLSSARAGLALTSALIKEKPISYSIDIHPK